MRILGTGVDLVEIARLEQSIAQHGERFLARLFTAEEQAYCRKFREPARCFAARFAAKEAVAKALGTGIGAQLEWLDITVYHLPTGRPAIRLAGLGAETAASLGVTELHLSLSHSEHYAIAQVIACTT